MKYATFGSDGVLVSRLIKGVNFIPKSAVEVDEKLWARMVAESDGVWTIDSDKVIKKQPIPAFVPTTEHIERMRLTAYADPELGSDRYFAEASRMEVMGEIGFEEVRARAIARFEEIQAQYPWPAK